MSPDKLVLNTGQGLSKNYSRTTEYYFNYGYTGTTYYNAEHTCMNHGRGWKLATFQALFIQTETRSSDDPANWKINWNPYFNEYSNKSYYKVSTDNIKLVDETF